MDGHWVLSPGWSFSSKFGETPTRDLKVLSVMQVCQFLTTNSSLITAIERWQNTEKKNIFWIPFFLFAFVRLVIPFPSKEKRPPQIATSVRRPVCMNIYRYLGPIWQLARWAPIATRITCLSNGKEKAMFQLYCLPGHPRVVLHKLFQEPYQLFWSTWY